jgi:exonuclease VII small subunit
MVAKTRRGAQLLNICSSRLTTTEQELKEVLADLQNPDNQ